MVEGRHDVRPSVTYSGSAVVIAWTRLDDLTPFAAPGLYARRYLPSGEPVDRHEILVSSDVRSPSHSATSGDRGDVLFAWKSAAAEIVATRLRADGTVYRPTIVSSGTPSSHSQPVVWRPPSGDVLFGYTDSHSDPLADDVERVVYTTGEAGVPAPAGSASAPRRRVIR